MKRIINLELLGHPVNVLVIMALIGLWYFGAFAVFKRAGKLDDNSGAEKTA